MVSHNCAFVGKVWAQRGTGVSAFQCFCPSSPQPLCTPRAFAWLSGPSASARERLRRNWGNAKQRSQTWRLRKWNNTLRDRAQVLRYAGWLVLFRHLLMIVQMCVGDKGGRVSQKLQKLHCALSNLDAFRSFWWPGSSECWLTLLLVVTVTELRHTRRLTSPCDVECVSLGVHWGAHTEKQKVI